MYFTNLLRMPSFATDSSPGSKEAILEGFRRTKCQSWRGIDNVSRGGVVAVHSLILVSYMAES